jgi:DNA-binding CsgD family transcriptional regulator
MAKSTIIAMEMIPSSVGRDLLAQLTQRENEVLRRAALGETNAQIAAGLGVTVHAVKFHLGSIFRKLDVANRTTAAAVYLNLGGATR